jgi:hypothetical protein
VSITERTLIRLIKESDSTLVWDEGTIEVINDAQDFNVTAESYMFSGDENGEI